MRHSYEAHPDVIAHRRRLDAEKLRDLQQQAAVIEERLKRQ